jgi:predicted small secreted protein
MLIHSGFPNKLYNYVNYKHMIIKQNALKYIKKIYENFMNINGTQ